MTAIPTLAIIAIFDETYRVSTKRQNDQEVFTIDKTNNGKPSLLRRLWPKTEWHCTLESAIQACRPISVGALTLELMLLGFKLHGIDLHSSPAEKSTPPGIYDFSGL